MYPSPSAGGLVGFWHQFPSLRFQQTGVFLNSHGHEGFRFDGLCQLLPRCLQISIQFQQLVILNSPDASIAQFCPRRRIHVPGLVLQRRAALVAQVRQQSEHDSGDDDDGDVKYT
jgi:hypothetical protein